MSGQPAAEAKLSWAEEWRTALLLAHLRHSSLCVPYDNRQNMSSTMMSVPGKSQGIAAAAEGSRIHSEETQMESEEASVQTDAPQNTLEGSQALPEQTRVLTDTARAMEQFRECSFYQSVSAIDPSICAGCANIIYAISLKGGKGAMMVVRMEKRNLSYLVHYDDVSELSKSSRRCRMCALLLDKRCRYRDSPDTPDTGILSGKCFEMMFRDRELFREAMKADSRDQEMPIQMLRWPLTSLRMDSLVHHRSYYMGIIYFLQDYMKKLHSYKIEVAENDRLLYSQAQHTCMLVEMWIQEFQSWYVSLGRGQAPDAVAAMKMDIWRLSRMSDSEFEDFSVGFRVIRGYRDQVTELSLPYLRLKVFTDRGDRFSEGIMGRSIQRHGDCLEITRLAKMWTDDCAQNHKECRTLDLSVGAEPILPSRVIDVGLEPNSTPRLISTKGQRARWVALSHCWGKSTGLSRTLRANVAVLEKEIKLSRLSPTFRDAIKLTQQLGIRYLWIDSLCIIQDCPKDWQRESAKMPTVYHNAYVTIAAAATQDSRGGFLIEREWTKSSKNITMPIPLDRGQGTVHFDLPNNELVPSTEVNYLQSRAWCFQESSLSHRLLTFDRLQLSYTCVRHGQIESRDLPHGLACEDRNTFLSQLYKSDGSNNAMSYEPLMVMWYNLLWDYTKRDLTFEKDKLVAISGIAGFLGSFLRDEYHAGLWRQAMPQNLLWSPYEEENLALEYKHARSSKAYCAPSWSWAAIDGSISNFICKQVQSAIPIATVLEVSTSLVGSGVYGQVSAGYIKIKGPLKQAVCGAPWGFWPHQPRLQWGFNTNSDAADDISHGIFDTTWPRVGTKVWCLQITDVYGLILIKAARFGRGKEYRRIGVFHLRTRANKPPPCFSAEDVVEVTIA
ncbi:heterokaryon incompatibility protein [Phlyctema vagabunda]|uniref:Heterokaryon incompatibility protein n=1 Tax=Phlyctema vagabunda TaxID=108571 RepID=A0ABR4PEJ1_9HELO